jgi:hypothetical protein
MILLSAALQLVSGSAAIARVITTDYYLSRSLGALAFATIAADYGVRFIDQGDTALLVGFLIFATLTIRNVLILAIPRLDRDRLPRFIVCAISFVMCSTLALLADIAGRALLEITTVLPFLALALGTLGESSNDMPTRRHYILAIGCVLSIFAVETAAWGLLAKSLISDVGAAIYAISSGRERGRAPNLAEQG